MNTTDCEKIECKLGKDYKNCNFNEEYVFENINSCERIISENVFSIHKNINKGTNDSVIILETMHPPDCTSLESTQICDSAVVDFDGLQALSKRWSPLGTNYDKVVTPSSELSSQESEMALFSSNKRDFNKQENDTAEMTRLEVEQEILASSLLALTSHFAHVQLRVRQIVEAPSGERDKLLKDLEQFAFQGIPETHSQNRNSGSSLASNHNIANLLSVSNEQQFELINHLKKQLEELEKFAYESGAAVLPQHIILEKQKIIIDELRKKLNFEVDEENLPELSTDEIKLKVDNAIGEFIGPLKMKDQLVAQLKTQIADLERFIAFLQSDTEESKMKSINSSEKSWNAYNSYAAKKKKESSKSKANLAKIEDYPEKELTNGIADIHTTNVPESLKTKSLHNRTHGVIDKASLIMQMFASTYLGAKREQFQKNTLKKTDKGNHWGDLRAQLEVDIQEVASLAATLNFDREKLTKFCKTMKNSKTYDVTEETKIPSVCSTNSTNNSKLAGLKQQKVLKSFNISSGSDDDDFNAYDYYGWQKQNNRRLARCSKTRSDTINILSKELTIAVRKKFAVTLMKLIQHGLKVISIPPVPSSLMVPFIRCLNRSPVFVAEHNYIARDFGASSYMSSTVSFDYEDSKGTDSSNYERAGFFTTPCTRPMHAWELILEYYHLKHGDEYNNTPARKLSQSFNLDIVNTEVVTIKLNLLSVVGNIIAIHRPYKRSYSAQFKAFVSAGLNCHQLVEWLNLIFGCTDLIENYYNNSSYVACTGFRDALRSIDILSKYNFDLPIDLAIRHFHNL